MGDIKLNSTGGGSVTLTPPSTASNLTLTLPSASGTVATTSGTGSVFTNPTINGFTGDTSAITVGTNQFVKDTSGNIGIGTSSPGKKLEVANSDIRISQSGTGNIGLNIVRSGGTTADWYNYLPSGTADLVWYQAGEKMRLDSSGNLGLGVTPSGWGSTFKALQGGAGSLWSYSTTGFGITANAYNNGGWKYVNNGYANSFETDTGKFIWYQSASGTAGNAISFTQAMTLDASGRLGIGVTSPGAPLDIYSAASQDILSLRYSTLGKVAGVYLDSTAVYFGGGANNYANAFSANHASNFVSLHTAGSERARIDSSGNLLVGTTSLTDKLSSETSSSTQAAVRANATNASYAGTVLYGTTTRGGTSGFDFIGMFANSVGQFRVSGAGTIYAQNTTVQSISDVRLKENIKDATDGLDVINALRPVRFDWKEGYGNDRKNQLGFIAQEVEPVFPDAVDEWGKVSQDDAETYKTVGPGALIPVLVKAIQELAAKNDLLEARIAAMEAK